MKQLAFLDYAVIAAYILLSFAIGNYYLNKAGTSLDQYFLSGRNMPWWLIGFSMAATNYSIDTPLAVTKLIAKSGVQGVWYLWSGGIAAVAAAFFFSRLWRRARVVTDAEMIKHRYSGKIGRFLRVFKGVYFGIVINCFVLGWVFKALVKVISSITPWSDWHILVFFGVITMIYTVTGGLSAVIMTDFFQYVIIIIGAITLAVFSVSYVGGLDQMVAKLNVLYSTNDYVNFMPNFSGDNKLMPWSAFLVYILIQWWSHKFSDGAGKHIQRMSSAKNETHAVFGSFFFATFTNILQMWPIIITALCSLIVFKGLPDPENGYPLMMTTILPSGILGLCVVGLLSAFMSTVSTHFNLGASYIINDIYRPYIKKDGSEKHYILCSRIATALVAISGMVLSLFIDSIADTWQFVLTFASGAGIIFIMRWFWWRINAYSELSAMVVSGIVASYIKIAHPSVQYTDALVLTIVFTIPVALLVTLLTKPVEDETLRDFYNRVKPGALGWKRIVAKYDIKRAPYLKRALVNFILGITLLFFGDFGIGTMLLKSFWLGFAEILIAVILAIILVRRVSQEPCLNPQSEECKENSK